ncbi:MAG: pyridoxamine 5'-phosphate oxidase family protein [Microbacteriaceae bacterium]
MSGLSAAPFWPTLLEWLPADEDPERPQIQLATLDEHGAPDIRTVLLTEFDDEGFWFNTDAASRKAQQLAADARVAIAMLWPGFTWQLCVQGLASPAPRHRLERAYARRSPYLRQLAWQNTAELAQLPHAQRVERWRVFQAEHDVAALEPPEVWTGYLVRPSRLTFWRADAETASQRVEYRLEDGAWTRWLLPG